MSIRLKLTLGLIIIILTSNIFLAFVTSIYAGNKYFKEVQIRVRLDLNSAHNIYNNYIDQIEQVLKAVSFRQSTILSLEQEVEGDLGRVLQNIYRESGVDFLTLVGSDGRVIYRAHNPQQKGDDLSEIPIIKKTLEEWNATKGTMVISNDLLNREGKGLARMATINIEETPKAKSSEKQTEDRGMIIAAAVPFMSLNDDNTKGKRGVLMGGYLLNNHYEIVDKIKSEVFQDQTYKGEDIGTATVFFDDLRISTNVQKEDRQRAVGSRMSSEVYECVINQGKVWADRAFVVNNWYITAYEPIRDPYDKIIGSLYVGLLEKPFKKPQKIIIIFFLAMVSFSSLASVILVYFYSNKLLRPIDNILAMSKNVIQGDLSARSNISPAGEMGVLCRSIDKMAEAIEQREIELQRDTQRQICQNEKLASIGQLSAGIAHEINNPLTGVLTFAHLLKEKNNNTEEDLKDIDIIIRETTRVREIVKGLLDFARQTPFKKESVNIVDSLHQITKLIKSQKEFKSIVFKENYSGNIPEFYGDKNQLQQVFFNIILNAGEAISKTGTITINVGTEENKIVVTIRDTGFGIQKENLVKIFDPFFTTKPVGKGTGLGLSISYGIIQQHGGCIKCKSEIGEGTTFKISLPLEDSKQKS